MNFKSKIVLIGSVLLAIIVSGCSGQKEDKEEFFQKFSGEILSVVNQEKNKASKESGVTHTVTLVNASPTPKDYFDEYKQSNRTTVEIISITKRTRIFRMVDDDRKQLIDAGELESNIGNKIELWVQPIKGHLHELEAIDITVLDSN